ncbi:uncharacterized protein Ir100a [Drosophila tropicalis]|uniref:uncharacterized protein Ir100a n=1 Tax=Drosophila tropicalis TaxID=46794 RepID=UPI0035ABDBF5
MLTTMHLIMLTLVGLTNGHANNFYKNVLESILNELEGGLELHLTKPSDFDQNLVQFILRQRSCTLTISSTEAMSSKEDDSFRHHFMLFEDVDEMTDFLPHLKNLGGFYILAIVHTPQDIRQLFKFAADVWVHHGHSRIYYIQLDMDRILVYNPFTTSLELVNDAMTYKRIYGNLNGHSLRVYTFDSVYSLVFGDGATKKVLRVTGADAKLAEEVAKALNFTQHFLWPDDEFFGGRTSNGSYSGGVGRAHRGEVDIIFSGFFIKDYLTTQIQFSSAVYMDDLCLYVQKAKRIPQSILPLFAVHEDVWLCFLLVGFISAFIWLCLRGLNLGLHIKQIADGSTEKKYPGFYSMAKRIFIDTWVVWVRVNVGRFPPFNSERMFLVSLCLVSVIFGALLESSLATVYIRPLYYKDTNTLAELDATQLPIYIKHPAFKDDLFYGHDSAVYRRLDSKMMLVAEGEERLISMISKLGKFAGVTRSASLELNDIRYVMTKKVHKIPECPKNYYIAYVLPRPSPYLDGINGVILRILAAGLMDLWTGEMKERARWSIHRFPEYLAELNVGSWKVLTLTDVQLAFYALGIGCLLAAAVWLLEMWWKNK